MRKEGQTQKQIQKLMERYVKKEFIAPFANSVHCGPVISIRLSNAYALFLLSERMILESDDKRNVAGKSIEAKKEKILFLFYLGKIYQSALFMMGAADYLSAMILLRGVFELLIGIATPKQGSMRDRISSIPGMSSEEKAILQKLWNDLCAWAHPYGKWIKRICPKLYSGRKHHPAIFAQCLAYSDGILDLILTITIEQFRLSPEIYLHQYAEICEPLKPYEICDLPMFLRRLPRK